MLWNWGSPLRRNRSCQVLILVLVDYALEPKPSFLWGMMKVSFNPCFSGLCFGTLEEHLVSKNESWVLILVLVDYALERKTITSLTAIEECFNPCFSGLCFGTGAIKRRMIDLDSFNPCFSGLCFGTRKYCNTLYRHG